MRGVRARGGHPGATVTDAAARRTEASWRSFGASESVGGSGGQRASHVTKHGESGGRSAPSCRRRTRAATI